LLTFFEVGKYYTCKLEV